MKKLSFLWAFLLFITPCRAEERALEDVIEEVNSAVVMISAENTDGEQALGAGIIVGAEGFVVTNAHVVENAVKTIVSTVNDDVYDAQIVGTDEKTDIALLKIAHPLGLEPAHFGDSDNVRVGNRVFAIGNPYGLGNSVSLGIISAKERDIAQGPYDNFLQTDASVNQGNSGGPLFNMQGEIIGMNTAIFSTDGRNQGLGFATPSNTLQWVMEQLKANGKVVRGWLGIEVGLIKTKDDPSVKQLAVVSMSENSPAASAGLKVGDVIERLGNISLKNARLFSAEVAATAPDTVLPFTVHRDGVVISADIKVAPMPQPQKVDTLPERTEKNDKNWVDVTELGIKGYYDDINQVFVVTEIAEDSDLFDKGIEVGQRLTMFNGKKVFGVEDLRVKIKEAREQNDVTLQFNDDNGVDTVVLNLKDN